MRSYGDFGGLCLRKAPSTRWANDVLQRNTAEPALFAYMVDRASSLLVSRSIIGVEFVRREGDEALAVQTASKPTGPLAIGALADLMIDYFAQRLTSGGEWVPGMAQKVIAACPELSSSVPGEIIKPTMTGMWALPMLSRQWVPEINRQIDLGVEPAHVYSR
ncbi:hypothetical protein [Geopseudomonas aromaticivorans]